MQINNLNIGIKDKILIVTGPVNKDVTKEDLIEIKMLLEESTGHTYEYGMYRNIVGYYCGFDFIRNDSVYCGSLNQKVALELMNEYKLLKENEFKNSSS